MSSQLCANSYRVLKLPTPSILVQDPLSKKLYEVVASESDLGGFIRPGILLNAPGKPVFSYEMPSWTIRAIPRATRNILSMPAPLKPARMKWSDSPGTRPTWGRESSVYPITKRNQPGIGPCVQEGTEAKKKEERKRREETYKKKHLE